MPKMTVDEVDGFLAEPGHLLRLGTVDAEGMPSVVPQLSHGEGALGVHPS